MNIEIISGSPRKDSVSIRLALHLHNLMTKTSGCNIGLLDIREWDLSTLQEDVFTSEASTPDIYRPLAKRMFAADAFILVSPEYNGSYTAILKNLFDHFPKQSHKTFGIVTASPGALGGIRAAMQMQQFILALFGIASPYMLVTPFVDKKFAADGELIDSSFQNPIDLFVREFVWLAKSLAK